MSSPARGMRTAVAQTGLRVCALGVLLALMALLAACAAPPVPPQSPSPVPPSPPLPSPAATATAVPTRAAAQNQLTICLSAEPDSLFLYAPPSPAALAVRAALYTPDFVTLGYLPRPLGLERLPSLENGDANVRLVPVTSGDRVVNARGDVVALAVGEQVVTSGGAVETFSGATLVMEQQVIDFVMKPRVWSDGRPVTADDSVYSFELARDLAPATDQYVITRTASYVATGRLRTRWTGLPGFRDTNAATHFWAPVPRHTWRTLSAAELLQSSVASRMPLGDGPFRLVSWLPGEAMIMERNPFYYRAGEGLPRLEAITFRFVPDVNARLAGLLDGSCDIVPRDGLTTDLLPFFSAAEADGLVQVLVRTGPHRRTLLLNAAPGVEGNRLAGPFAAPGLRQAAALCLNRGVMAQEMTTGRSAPSSSYVPADHPLYAADVTLWVHDRSAANRLLDEQGYNNSSIDGVRETPGGSPLAWTLLAARDPVTRRLAELIAFDFRSCGMQLTLDLRDDFDPEMLAGRPFDLALTAPAAAVVPDCDRYASWRLGGAAGTPAPPGLGYTGPDYANLSGWSDPAFDAVCAAALRAPFDSEPAHSSHQEAQRIFAAALPAVPLYLEPAITAARPEVLHLNPDPSSATDLWNLFAIDVTGQR